MSEPVDVAGNLRAVLAAIDAACASAGRPKGSVDLVAVSKLQPIERIEAALGAGQRRFGENYVQEAAGRWPALRERFQGLELHMIGPLQSNKAAQAVGLFDVIQTIDRVKLAREIAKAMDKQGRRPRLLVQVNTGEEPQKAGVLPGEVDGFLTLCRDELGLTIDGLMAIPPADDEVDLHAALLGKIARRNGLATLSVGMSDDYETAIRFGATMVRVGSAIFGARPLKG